MKLGYHTHQIECPHCGQQTILGIDSTTDEHQFVDRCNHCYHSITLQLEVDQLHQQLRLFVLSDDEQLY
ncbi:MAG: CPXCG motif-containing cysteine-rich protein [Ferrimonas sp.]